jgi:hypothetical protein
MDEQQNNINIACIFLIAQCHDAGSEEMTIEQKKVTKSGMDMGDWEITIKKIKK